MSTHTPGPWIANGDEVYSKPAYQSVCMVLGVVGEAEANARLIAAAPDLLGACMKANEWLAGWASADPYLGFLRAAIEKALLGERA